MSQENLMKVLLAPRVSEKTTRLAEADRQFVFQVDKAATKPQVKQAVELMFSVEVESVQITNVRGKTKTFRRSTGRRPGWKKAYVKLKPGFDIDFASVE